MLRALSIRDFVIVDRLDLEFGGGFTVLTGETGAGKSILVDALALALGERGEAGVVRQGAERAEIGAEFDAAGPLARWLEDNDLADEGGACLLRRVIDAAGRSRAFINGRAATLAQLKAAGELAVDIHGQHQHQSLTRPAAQRALLDAYGGLETDAAAVAEAWRAWRQRRDARVAFESGAAAFAAERERLEWQVRELEALNLAPGEWPQLAAEHARLAHAAALIEAAQYGVDALSEGEGASLPRINGVIARLQNLVEHDARLQQVLDALEPARIQLQEAVHELRRYGERTELDPQRLREVERRLDAVHSAARKHRSEPEALPALLESARAQLERLEAGGDIEALLGAEREAHAALLEAARRLAREVTAAMQTLAMEGGAFEVALPPVEEPAAHGLEQVEFRVSTHKGMAPQPLSRVASGGELSRIGLALQTAASRVAKVPTLIFDEVDAGIGGRVAEIVGNLLSGLGRRYQVLCITHLPQVAAAADHQWRVVKSTAGGRVSSRLAVLDPAQRVEEIARMLGGVRITETTRRHAAEMLAARGARRT
jgi:DNA repair protein RecN (Recombination protein N)